jgi:deoxyribonuclease V
VILGVDVHYEDHAVRAAGVGFEVWEAAAAVLELVVRRQEAPAPYEPGRFYRRELPHLMAIVDEARKRGTVDVVIVDGHVWLEEGMPGLGAHLAQAMGGGVVVGVAKTSYRGGVAIPVLRGDSASPLYVSAVGMETSDAAERVCAMHGPFRMPTLLKRVDSLARGH